MIIFITGILTDYRRSKNVEKDIKFGWKIKIQNTV